MKVSKTKRGLQWLACLALLAILDACGGGGSDPTYTVSFTVTGELPPALTIRNGCCDDVVVTALGTYTFATALPTGAHYDLGWIQPNATVRTCTSTNGNGALVANGGPAAQQIVFTSDQGAAAAAGDWLGIVFNDVVDAANAMSNTRVEFAGGQTISNNASCPYPGRVGVNYAAIRIFGTPTGQFITNSTIVASLRDGIDRGWRSDLQPDFLPSNTFTNVGGCKESTPRTAAGVCPAVPACP